MPNDRHLRHTGLLAVLLAATGCLTPGRNTITLKVPYQPQEPEQCGAAALAMVLNYWGYAETTETLGHELLVPAIHGTIPALIADAARTRGFEASIRSVPLASLPSLLREGIPPIVFLAPEAPATVGHFAVVTGMRADASAIRLHGPRKPNQWWARERFLQRWKKNGTQAILILPAGHPVGATQSTAPKSMTKDGRGSIRCSVARLSAVPTQGEGWVPRDPYPQNKPPTPSIFTVAPALAF